MIFRLASGQWLPVCDGCDTTLPPEPTLRAATAATADAAWIDWYYDGEQLHECPDCLEAQLNAGVLALHLGEEVLCG